MCTPYECVCRACRWGLMENGPFGEFTYYSDELDGWPRGLFIHFNDMEELRCALQAKGVAHMPILDVPAA